MNPYPRVKRGFAILLNSSQTKSRAIAVVLELLSSMKLLIKCCWCIEVISDMVFALTKLKTEREGVKQDRDWLNQATERLKQETELLMQERDRLQQRWSWIEVWTEDVELPMRKYYLL